MGRMQQPAAAMKPSEEERCAIITLHKLGKTNRKIAKALKVSTNKVWHAVKRYQEVGNGSDRPRSGHPRTQRTPKVIKAVAEQIC